MICCVCQKPRATQVDSRTYWCQHCGSLGTVNTATRYVEWRVAEVVNYEEEIIIDVSANHADTALLALQPQE